MSTSFEILKYEGSIEALEKLASTDELPGLGDWAAVRQGIDSVLPNVEWREWQGKVLGQVQVYDVSLEFTIRRQEIIRDIHVTARGGGNRGRLIASLCRPNGWRAIDLSEGRFVELNRIQYLNTDLEVESAEDLAVLVAALETAGLLKLQLRHHATGLSVATFASNELFDEPEKHIARMLSAVEPLTAPLLEVWNRSMRREFLIGYDCGTEPAMFSNHLSNPLLQRIAAAGASVVIALYPPDAPTRRL